MAGPETRTPPLPLRAGLNSAAWLVQLLGKHRYRLSDPLANAAFALQPGRRRTTCRNYRAALGLGPRQARRLAAQSYREYGRTSLDFLYIHRLPRRRLMPLVRATGIEHLEETQRQGRGGILVMMHLGSWDVAAAYAAALGLDLTAIMADEQSQTMADLVIWARAQMGVRVVTASHSPRAMLATLRAGDWLGLLSDIPGDTPSVRVEFLGRQTSFSIAPGLMAARTGAPLLPVICTRTGNGTYLGEVHPPVPVRPEASPEEALAGLLPVFEAAVRRWPEQWFPFDQDRLLDPSRS